MQNSPPSSSQDLPLQESLLEAAEELKGKAERVVREYPLISVGCAFAAGLLLSGRIFGGPTVRAVSGGLGGFVGRSLVSLAKPTLLYYGQQALFSKAFPEAEPSPPPQPPVTGGIS